MPRILTLYLLDCGEVWVSKRIPGGDGSKFPIPKEAFQYFSK